MASIAGKASVLAVSPTAGGAGTYSTVTGIKSYSHSIDGAALDDSEIGIAWVQRIQGLKDGKISITGQRRYDNTLGQNAILSALIGDTTLWYRILYDGTVGYKQECKVAKFSVDGAVDDKVNLSIELEGTGAVVAI